MTADDQTHRILIYCDDESSGTPIHKGRRTVIATAEACQDQMGGDPWDVVTGLTWGEQKAQARFRDRGGIQESEMIDLSDLDAFDVPDEYLWEWRQEDGAKVEWVPDGRTPAHPGQGDRVPESRCVLAVRPYG